MTSAPLQWCHLGMSLWILLAFVTACELYFALFVDVSDAFNTTNLSKRWFERHIDSQRNSFGARDIAEFTRRPSAGKTRICFFGDSFTIGHGIDRYEDRFTDRVAAELERRRPGEFEVANLGDPGLEISQIESRIHGLFNDRYEMDVVVYVICLNDIEAYDSRTETAIRGLQRAQPRFFLWTETYFLNWMYYRYLQASQPGAHNYFPHLVDSYSTAAWDGFARKLSEMAERCTNHNAEFRVVIFPFLTELGHDYPFLAAHKKIVSFCRQSGISVLDLEPTLRDHAAEELTVNRFDSHPNERAHAIAAEAIEQQLLSDLSEHQE